MIDTIMKTIANWL